MTLGCCGCLLGSPAASTFQAVFPLAITIDPSCCRQLYAYPVDAISMLHDIIAAVLALCPLRSLPACPSYHPLSVSKPKTASTFLHPYMLGAPCDNTSCLPISYQDSLRPWSLAYLPLACPTMLSTHPEP